MNRFSKDIFTIDENLVSTLGSYLATIYNVLGVIIVISSITPIFAVCLIPMIAFYLKQQGMCADTNLFVVGMSHLFDASLSFTSRVLHKNVQRIKKTGFST